MSYHSGMKWDYDDGCTDEVVAEVAAGVRENKRYRGDGKYHPGAYMILSTVDGLIFCFALMMDKLEGEFPDEAGIAGFTDSAPETAVAAEIFRRVIIELKADPQGDGEAIAPSTAV